MNQPLESRIQALFDGTITEEEFRHLEDELIANPEARKIYYQYASLQQSLEFRLSRTNTQSGVPGLADARLAQQRTRSRRFAVFTAAALLIITLVTMHLVFVKQSPEQPNVDFASAPGTLFTLTHRDGSQSTNNLYLEPESRLQISQGTVELKFPSGVRAIVQGPADMTLHNKGKLYMSNGTGWFHVPEKARGFTVTTRELNIIDLGTQFGVVSHPEKEDEVHVFKGKVRVEALHGVKKEIILTKNEAIHVKPYGRFTSTSSKEDIFLKTLPKTLPHMHWSFDHSEGLIASNTISDASDINYRLHSTANPSYSGHIIPGQFGNALSLDGIGNYLETNWPGILGSTPRSIAFWFKMPPQRSPENIPTPFTRTIIGWGTQRSGDLSNHNSKWSIHLDYTLNRYPMLNISFGGFWYYSPDIELDDNRWHHITVTYSGEPSKQLEPITRLHFKDKPTQGGQDAKHYRKPVLKLYVNGEECAIESAAYQPVRTHKDGQIIINTMEKTPLVIGATLSRDRQKLIEPNQFIKAQIDELYIIEGVITKESAQHLMKVNKLTH